MNWSNWIYLAVGLGLGAALRSLFTRPQPSVSAFAPLTLVPEAEAEDVQALSESIRQTQLAYQMAREMEQFKAGFLARITHELRSPLNGLIGLHQLILSDLCENPEEEHEFIEQAHERALQLLKIIDEVLNVARTEYGSNRLEMRSHSVAEVLKEVHGLTHMLAKNRNYPFQVTLPEPQISVITDRRWLRQILLSLVETSIACIDADIQEGSIYLSATSFPTGTTQICLDIPIYALPKSEAIDLLTITNQSSNTTMTVGMKFLLNQTLVEAIGGKLEILPSPQQQASNQDLIRLQISISQKIPEAELLLLEAS
jgi:K+-sensing histidine kinase KdpD